MPLRLTKHRNSGLKWARTFALLSAFILTTLSPASSEPIEVDVELVLAADRSGSMSFKLLRAQREGFARAFLDPELQFAITSGPIGRIAVTYFEWSDIKDQQVIVPWMILSTPEDIEAFSSALLAAPYGAPGGQTSISGSILYAQKSLANNDFTAYRKVVDISSNGKNSNGPEVDQVLAMISDPYLTINGLILPDAFYAQPNPYDALFARYEGSLEDYFQREVVSGPNSFTIAVTPETSFTEAILRKLVMEIAWVAPSDQGLTAPHSFQ